MIIRKKEISKKLWEKETKELDGDFHLLPGEAAGDAVFKTIA